MVEEENPVMSRDLLSSLHDQPCDVGEITIDTKRINLLKSGAVVTYLLPVGNLSGLISLLLKAAKKSSIGEASYECGPVNMTGTEFSS